MRRALWHLMLVAYVVAMIVLAVVFVTTYDATAFYVLVGLIGVGLLSRSSRR